MDKEMLKGSIDILILSLLYHKDLYGYQIAKELRESSHDDYDIGDGTLYPALKRLEKKEYLTSYWQVTKEGKKRKYYHLTEEGRKSFIIKVKQWKKVNSLVLKLTPKDIW